MRTRPAATMFEPSPPPRPPNTTRFTTTHSERHPPKQVKGRGGMDGWYIYCLRLAPDETSGWLYVYHHTEPIIQVSDG